MGVTSCPPIPPRPEDPGSEIPALPREVLQVLSQRLGHSVALGTRDGDRGTGLGQALLLLKFFIIICRWVTPNPSVPSFSPAPGIPSMEQPQCPPPVCPSLSQSQTGQSQFVQSPHPKKTLQNSSAPPGNPGFPQITASPQKCIPPLKTINNNNNNDSSNNAK